MRHIPSMLAISALLAVGAATASAQSTGYVGPPMRRGPRRIAVLAMYL